MKKLLLLFTTVAMILVSTINVLQAQLNGNQPFNPPEPFLSATPATGVWYPDRYPPAIFDSYVFNSENVLRLGIDLNDGLLGRPSGYNYSFYNTQGRNYNLANDVSVLYGSLYIPADWATKHRRSDLWATSYDASNTVASYPIIGFANTTGSNPAFRYWDELNDTWINSSYTVTYDQWYNFKMVLSGPYFYYYINGTMVGTVSSKNSAYMGNLIVQGYNFNDNTLGSAYDGSTDATYEIYWDNIGSYGGPITWAPKLIREAGTTVVVPIKVRRFIDINAVSLRLTYDTDKLIFVPPVPESSAMGPLVPAGSTYIVAPVPGTVNISHTTTSGFNLPDNSVLINLTFTYTTGLAPLTWLDDITSIDLEYQNATTQLPYIDVPTATYYIPGYVTNGVLTFTREYPGYPPVPGALTQGIIAHLTGGTGTLSYSWTGPDGPAGTTQRITPTSYGDYTVTITDADGATISGTYHYDRVHNIDSMLDYHDIQAAIDVAAATNTLVADAGDYYEDILIDVDITLNGNNAGLNGCLDGHTNPESIIYPLTNDANPVSPTSMPIIYVTANGVTIDGFTLDGSSGATSTYIIEGVMVNAIEGVGAWDGVANLEIMNNIIKNLTDRGVDIYNWSNGGAMTTGNKVHHNKFFNINPKGLYLGAGAGVLVYNNAYVDITYNCMDQVRKGVQTGNYSLANAGGVSPLIAYNDIKSYKIGIWHNLAYGTSSAFDINNNQIQNTLSSTENSGIEISSLGGTTGVSITANTVTGAMAGIELWSNSTSSIVTVGSTNTFTSCTYGVFANNWDGYSDNAVSSSYIVDGCTITTPVLAGVYVKDNSLNSNAATVSVVVQNNTKISGTASGLKAFLIEGADASLSFSGAAPQATVTGAPKYFVLQTNGTNVPAGNIDATLVMLDGNYGSGMSLPVLFDTEDKIDHKIDYFDLGFVKVKDLNTYVTVISFVSPMIDPKIQRAVDAAGTPSWTVNVKGGTYKGQVLVDKALTVLGPYSGVPGAGGRSGEAILIPLVSDPENSVLLGITADNVIIKGLCIDGSNTDLDPGSGYDLGGIYVHTSDGIQNGSAYGDFPQINHITIENNVIKNMSYDGILLQMDYEGVSAYNTIKNNYFTNMWEGIQCYAVYADISNNTIFNCNAGLSLHQVKNACPGDFTPQIKDNVVRISVNNWSPWRDEMTWGIWVNGYKDIAPAMSVSGNTVNTPYAPPTGKYFDALYCMYITGGVDLTWQNNTINGDGNCKNGFFGFGLNTTVKVKGGIWNGITDYAILVSGHYDASSWPSPLTPSGILVQDVTIDGVGSLKYGIGALEDGVLSPLNTAVATINTSTVKNCANAGILADGAKASVVVDNNAATIQNNPVGIDVTAGGTATITTSTIKLNGIGVRFATGGNLVTATNNFIINNTTDGIRVESGSAGSIGPINSNDLSGNGTWAIDNLSATPIADATCNWYGMSDVAGVTAEINGTVDFDPWRIGNADGGDPGFVPTDPCNGATNLYVNDADITLTDDFYTSAIGSDANSGIPTAPFLTIMKAVNTAVVGTNIWVDAGPFPEQVFIGKTLNLTGVDSTKTIVKAPAVGLLTPVSWYNAMPVVYASGSGNTVNISKIAINGDGGRSVDEFVGMLYYEAMGTFNLNKITGIHDAGGFTGMQSGHAFYGVYTDGTTQTLNITNNIIIDYQKGGIYVDGAGANTDVLIDGNTVIGQGVANVTAQNGISPAWCDAIITDNLVTNNIWNAVEHPHVWTASGIVPYQTLTTTITGNTMNGNEVALYGYQVGTAIYGVNTFNNNKIHLIVDLAPQINAGNIYDKTVLNPAQLNIVYGCIQYAEDESAPGDQVNASAHTFIENVVVHAPVIINGAGMNSTKVIPAISAPNPGGASSLAPGSSHVFLVQADNVTIQNLTVDGDNPAISTPTYATDARNGIIVNYNEAPGIFNNLNVNHVKVQNIYLRGLYASSGGTFNFNLNTVTNVAGNGQSIAMMNYAGAGSFTNNTVSYSNDGIVSNYSSGTTYSGNNVSFCGSGIHTDNNGAWGGTADNIFSNVITNGTTGAYGIWVFASYLNNQVYENNVSGTTVGLCASGQMGGTPLFTRNTVTGNQYGVSTTTSLFGWGSSNCSVLFTNNFIDNNTVEGFDIEAETGFTNTTTANNNRITGNSTGVAYSGGGTLNLDFNCNWWGSSDFATVAAAVGASNPPVDYSPWLSTGGYTTPGFIPTGTCNGLASITGTMKYYHPTSPVPMNGVQLALKNGGGSTITTATVDGSGNYTFTDDGIINGTYTIDVTANPKTPGSINSTDAAQVNTWGVTHSYSIEYVRFLAGDVHWNIPANNHKYIIDPMDAQHIQLQFVYHGSPNQFDRDLWSYWKKNDWVNADANHGALSVTVYNANVTGFDLYGQSTGDFNSSYLWSAMKGVKSNVMLTYGDALQANVNTEVELPLRIVNASTVGATSLILNFPSNLAEIMDVTMDQSIGQLDWAVKGDELRIGWNSAVPLTLAAGDALINIRLVTTGEFLQGQSIRFSLTADPLNELADGSFETIPDAELSINTLESSALGIPGQTGIESLSLASYPNPFANYTTLKYTLPSDGQVTLEISNVLGMKVATVVNELQTSGTYSFKLDALPLQPGVYTATIKLVTAAGDMVKTIKLVRNR